jgi:hypothetical protein
LMSSVEFFRGKMSNDKCQASKACLVDFMNAQ